MSRLGTALRVAAGAGVALLAGFVPSEVIGWLRGSGGADEERPPASPRRSESAHSAERRAVEDVLDTLDGLDEADMLALKALWDDQSGAMRERAWRHAKSIIERRGLDDSLYWAREAVAAWAGAARTDFSGIEGLLGRPGTQVCGRQVAVPAVLDAVAAILARDELSADEEATLSTPWAEVTGRLRRP